RLEHARVGEELVAAGLQQALGGGTGQRRHLARGDELQRRAGDPFDRRPRGVGADDPVDVAGLSFRLGHRARSAFAFATATRAGSGGGAAAPAFGRGRAGAASAGRGLFVVVPVVFVFVVAFFLVAEE